MNDMCTDCDRDFLCFKSTAGRPRGSWQQTVSRSEKSACPVGHVSSTVNVPGRKIYVPRALGHALMSSPDGVPPPTPPPTPPCYPHPHNGFQCLDYVLHTSEKFQSTISCFNWEMPISLSVGLRGYVHHKKAYAISCGCIIQYFMDNIHRIARR